jgi:predicted helicase
VYTPREIVDYMCNSVEEALKEEFGLTLASPEVVILDPCTGTGNFIVNLIERMPGKALAEAYQNRIFANEVMLLPYYVASLNIEHAYYERMKQYESFPGLCFVDTLDMVEARQIGLFTLANTERVAREKEAAITVIIGNPPYNVGQKSENENNPNRKYKVVDGRIRDTYAKDSKATSKTKLDDAYVRFFRWATDRLGDRDGIVCFVSNNAYIHKHAFDGMRKHLWLAFEHIDHIDLHGNVRQNPKLSGTTHNVFGIQVGVGITLGPYAAATLQPCPRVLAQTREAGPDCKRRRWVADANIGCRAYVARNGAR